LPAARIRTGKRRWIAVAAAYLVVLQAIFAGLSAGAHAASLGLDRSLATPLCTSGEIILGQGGDAAAAIHDQTSCCTSGCAYSGSGPAAPGSFTLIARRPVAASIIAIAQTPAHGFVTGRLPANPRAPPALG
jgi:hypothetical protein